MTDETDSLAKILKDLQDAYKQYSTKDVAETLFVSSLWLPNISSWLKHQILVAAFASTKSEEFSDTDQINSYANFEALLTHIFPLLPSVPIMEDYIPQFDWGDIRYFFEGISYKIFYGCNIETVYDFLYVFDLMFASHNDEIQPMLMRSPRIEFLACLKLQHTIISCIPIDQNAIDFENIVPGHIEIPTEKFWTDARAYYNAFDSIDFVPEDVFEHYSVRLGSDTDVSRVQANNILRLASHGELIDFFFVEHDGKYYSVLPRMFSEVLIEKWAKLFKEYKDQVLSKIDYQKELTLDLLVYVRQRHQKDQILALPSPTLPSGEPEDPIFACGFISRDRLFLIYVLSPFVDDSSQAKLADLSIQLNVAIDLVSQEPTTLALHMDKKNVIFASERKTTPKPEIIVVIPTVSIEGMVLPIPEDFPATVMFMHDFLGLFDELDDLITLSDFFDFLAADDPNMSMMPNSYVDQFGAFRDMQGVLVHGAREVNLILLDPHWGSHQRYETLKTFWSIFPTRVGSHLGHPRSWETETISGKQNNLVSRQYIGRVLLREIGNVLVLINSPLHLVSRDTARIADLITEALEDSLAYTASILSNHPFFQSTFMLQITVYPIELIHKDEEYEYLRSLTPSTKGWDLDGGSLGIRKRGIRIAIDETIISESMMNSTNRSLEANLVSDIIIEIDKFVSSSKLDEILEQLEQFGDNKPRYMRHEFAKIASFPEYISPSKPEDTHRKAAGKLIAQTALVAGISPGEYKGKSAKDHLNSLRHALVDQIDALVKQYMYHESIPFLIGKIDALTDEYYRTRKSIEASLAHEVEYDRAERSANHEIEFVTTHRAYSYLIEKFVQLTPSGSELMNEPQFQKLIALTQRLLQVYQASDSLHYGAYPVIIDVDEDFIISVRYEADIDKMQQVYRQEIAQIELGLSGNVSDQLDFVTSMADFTAQIDEAFNTSIGFRFTTMLTVLRVLSLWAEYTTYKEATFYNAEADELFQVFEEAIEDTTQDEFSSVLEFLTLHPDQMLVVTGEQSASDDLPVWEHYKRPAKYNIRPLIHIKDKYYWGGYSANRTSMIWISAIQSGKLPFDCQQPAIDKLIEAEMTKIQKAIVTKTAEIISGFTSWIETEVELHKRDKAGNHPAKLGDYDVLAYIKEKNVILNIECKDILPAFCMKDDSRVRRKFFEDGEDRRGFLGKVERREAYLTSHPAVALKILGYRTTGDEVPKVISLFVSRRSYWWTRFPPVETDVQFITLDILRDFLSNL
jgi:hypothetical protein